MRVFVCETVTGGFYAGAALPEDLIAEGALMRDALIGDLEDLPGIRVVTTHDARLPPPPRGASRPVGPGDDAGALWDELAAEAQCCWPIAPECEGILARLVKRLRTRNSRVIAPDDATLRICASKRETAEVLARAGVPVIPTWRPGSVPRGQAGPFVIKPDDGAGALDVILVANLPVADLPIANLPAEPIAPGAIIQPLVEGAAASLSLLCQQGRTHVLAANRQHVAIIGGRFRFSGVTVGAFPVDDTLRMLAERIGAALPGLSGLVGIDYLATPTGPVVIEVNPRLTTSYVGLRRALAVNPLAFVAELIRDGEVPEGDVPNLPHLPPARPVEINL
ncbi:ATP-grasp domain-containing protein [Ancylobacter amanitiformis]|uniref:ATP-grasp superfamily ATP-dependent carboligase n=1 Tax=Ancylobacter amanitiformis TaxID=217069 RepID=A0ABU0LM51_9HYPH|nr:ATP-grasp domain-containing protein [Ancylobacter amanitiformis]MDQ0509779.1 putative ATP-grasp superfamily ATP-dependent carboligase [Ancylobacter amanitiformis]